MDLLATTEAAQKFSHLIQLRAAVERAREAGEWVKRASGEWHRKYTWTAALILQKREEALKEFLSTMPLRVVR
jgi:hypothetical protein